MGLLSNGTLCILVDHAIANFHKSRIALVWILDYTHVNFPKAPADEEMVEGVRGSHHTQVASALFPSALCSAVAEIVSLLDDAAAREEDGCSVYEIAYQVGILL